MIKAGRKKQAKLFVVSAPSGCGKTTLCERLLEEIPVIARSVSATTRRPRPGEKNGRDYRFVSKARFEKMIRSGELLEHEENFGHLYGTPKDAVKISLASGKPVLLSIDVKGAMKVRRAYPRRSVLIFILPPSIAALKKRLAGRKSEGRRAMSERLAIAERELSYRNKYDYSVINDNLGSAFRKLKAIVLAEAGMKAKEKRRRR